jgi:hypothetical protein
MPISLGYTERLSITAKNDPILIDLIPNLTTTHEAYIKFGNYLKIGSSNSSFIIRDIVDNPLFILNNSDIIFNQDIYINERIVIGNNTEISDTLASFYNEFHIILNNCNFIITNNNYNVVNISSNICTIQNENIKLTASSNITINSELYIHSNLYVDNIKSFEIGGSVRIENLILTDAMITDGLFKNQITIEQHKLSNMINVENVSFSITRDKTSYNFIELANYTSLDIDESNIFTVFDCNGNLGIGLYSNLLAPLHIETTYNNKSLFIHGDGDLSILNIDNYARIGIGTNENKGLLHINRGDDLIEQNIRKEPLLRLNIDYNQTCNYTNSNLIILSNLAFSSNNIFIHINTIYPELAGNGLNIYITYDMDLNLAVNNENTLFNYNGYSNPSYRLDNDNHIGEYDIIIWEYSPDILTFITTTQFDNIVKEGSNIWLSNEIYFIDSDKLQPVILITTSNIYYQEDMYIIHIHSTIYKKNVYNVHYVDTTPILIPPPYFTLITSNLKELIKINEIGHVFIGNDLSNMDHCNHELNVYGTTYLEQLIVPDIVHDINMNMHNIVNIQEMNFNNNFKITSNGIFVDGVNALGQKVAQITTANISNITSTYFKYNDINTSILNSFCVGRNSNVKMYYECNIYPDATMILTTNGGDGLIVINDIINSNVDSIISIISSNNERKPILNFNNNNTHSSILIQNDIFKLKGTYDSNEYFKYIIHSNILTLGSCDMITIYDNDIENIINNKIVIGNPSITYAEYTLHNTENRINYFKNNLMNGNPYNINIFGDIMIKNHNSKNLLSTYSSGTTDFIYLFGDASSNIANIKYKLTVDGNITCNTGGIENADALYVNGPSSINGTLVVIEKIYAISGISSLSDRNVKDELQIITNSLEKIKQLTGYTYKRTDTGKKETGLIAQDVEKVLPEVINKTKDDKLSIDYGNMMGLVVEAIKSLEKRLNTLEDILK